MFCFNQKNILLLVLRIIQLINQIINIFCRILYFILKHYAVLASSSNSMTQFNSIYLVILRFGLFHNIIDSLFLVSISYK